MLLFHHRITMFNRPIVRLKSSPRWPRLVAVSTFTSRFHHADQTMRLRPGNCEVRRLDGVYRVNNGPHITEGKRPSNVTPGGITFTFGVWSETNGPL